MMKQILLGLFKGTEAAVVCGSAVDSSMYFSSCQNRVLGKECVIFNPLKEANLHVLCKMLPDNTVQTASERKQRGEGDARATVLRDEG